MSQEVERKLKTCSPGGGGRVGAGHRGRALGKSRLCVSFVKQDRQGKGTQREAGLR